METNNYQLFDETTFDFRDVQIDLEMLKSASEQVLESINEFKILFNNLQGGNNLLELNLETQHGLIFYLKEIKDYCRGLNYNSSNLVNEFKINWDEFKKFDTKKRWEEVIKYMSAEENEED